MPRAQSLHAAIALPVCHDAGENSDATTRKKPDRKRPEVEPRADCSEDHANDDPQERDLQKQS